MAKEIEKKYLIYEKGKDYSTKYFKQFFSTIDLLMNELLTKGHLIHQGYLPIDIGKKLAKKLEIGIDFELTQARLRDVEGDFTLTFKGKGDVSRDELEYKIGREVFGKYWGKTLGKRLDKFRLEKTVQKMRFDIDYYPDFDLIIAEVEVGSIEEANNLKDIGKYVTGVDKYKNPYLAR